MLRVGVIGLGVHGLRYVRHLARDVHPEARYFGTGRIGRVQVDDYAQRRGVTRAAAEKALTPVLGYDPDE